MSYVRNIRLLDETHKLDDLLGHSKYAEKLSMEISFVDGIKLIGVIGPYGIGKSVMVEELKKLLSSVKWIQFDAWKYPDRRDLWEGFILDLADQLGDKILRNAKIKLDGNKDAKTTLLKTAGSLTKIVLSPIPLASDAVDGVVGGLSQFVKESPAKRIQDVQVIFPTLINEIKEDSVCIVVEDADRSGDYGIYFLETLKHYVKSLSFDKNITVLILASDTEYANREASFIKFLDEVRFFDADHIDIKNYIKNTFDNSEFGGTHDLENLEHLFHFVISRGFTIRKLKLALRNSVTDYRRYIKLGLRPDPIMCIVFALMKFMTNEDGYSGTMYSRFKKQDAVNDNGIISNLFCAIANDESYETVTAKHNTRIYNHIHSEFKKTPTDKLPADYKTARTYFDAGSASKPQSYCVPIFYFE